MAELLIFAWFIPAALTGIEFVLFLFGKGLPRWLRRIVEALTLLVLPLVFLSIFDKNLKNDCCWDSAFFSPAYRNVRYALILICIIAYVMASVRVRILPPLPEVLINVILLVGIALNVVMMVHQDEPEFWPFFVAIILFHLMTLVRNHRLFLAQAESQRGRNMVEYRCWQLLHASPWAKYPLLLILCVPLLAVLSGLLMLFGQKSDSFIRAFTDTYRHGLSQLDHECAGVVCGGHYLCTVAARGHASVVHPERLGVRGGKTIICNRQLLVANAFEELVQQRFPRLHKVIRRNYDRVGEQVERHYHLLDRKWVSDVVHVAMKPLEWVFVLVLYTFDRHPERRIAVQYLSVHERRCIADQLALLP